MKVHRSSVFRAWAAGVFAAAVVLTNAAPGQTMSVSVARPQETFAPDLSSRDLAIISRVLNLGDAEREAARALHDGYLAALRARSDAVVESMQERIERAQAVADLGAAQASDTESEAWVKEAEQLRDGFFADLKSLLSRQQADRWPLVERELRRIKRIGSGRSGGESVDVIRVVDEVAPTAWSNPAIADILGTYASRLDSLLQQRDEATGGEKSQEFDLTSRTDRAAAERLWESAQTARIRVRDLNLNTAEQVASLLPEQEGDRLRRKVLELSHPNLVKKSRTESFIRAAGSLESLSADQQSAVRTILDRYDRDLWSLIKDMASVAREQQLKARPVQLAESGMKVATTASGESISFYSPVEAKADPKDPMTALKVRRYELDHDTKRKLMPVLTEKQIDACRQPTIDQLYFGEDVYWGL